MTLNLVLLDFYTANELIEVANIGQVVVGREGKRERCIYWRIKIRINCMIALASEGRLRFVIFFYFLKCSKEISDAKSRLTVDLKMYLEDKKQI